MRSINYKFKDLQDLKNFIDSNIEDKNSRDILIQMFSAYTDKKIVTPILETINLNLPKSTLIGATTDGEILDGSVLEDSIIISFSVFEKSSLDSTIVEYNNDDFLSVGRSIANQIITNKSKVLIALSDGLNTNGEELLSGIKSINKDIYVSGGLAGDYNQFKNTFIFYNKEIKENATVAVVINSDNLEVYSHYNFNWQAIGKSMTITKSNNNIVYTIDNIKAIDIYEKYLGEDIAKQLPAIGIEFPLIIEEDGLLIARAVLAKNVNDGSLRFAGNLKEGTKVKIGIGDSNLIESNSLDSLDNLNNRPIESIFIYSCMARRRFLGNSINSEIEAISSVASTVGFFTYGEYHTQNTLRKSRLLNESMSILGLSENINKTAFIDTKKFKRNSDKTTSNKILGLSKLINTISKELNELNRNLEDKVSKRTNLILKQYYTDSLTKLPNRLKLINDLNKTSTATIILLNIDHFSKINDFYGSKIGDFIIQRLGRFIKKVPIDYSFDIYKLPADEFIILIKNTTIKNKSLKHKIAISIINFIKSKDFKYKKHNIHINITVAIAEGNSDVLIQADMARKFAKKQGKDYQIYDNLLSEYMNYSENIIWSKKLEEAINTNRIEPFFQPIISNSSNGNEPIEKYESLIRLIDDDKNIVSPYKFMKISKTTKQYHKLTQIMIEKSFKTFKDKDSVFSINISIDDILNKQTELFIYRYLEEHLDCSQRLILEIVESEAIESIEEISYFIEKVREYGVKIAIDDFGTGYSNFEYLTKIEPDFIKIDGSLIKNIDTDEKSLIIVETIVEFAKKLNSKTIAEFVHSEKVFDIVKNLDIDYLQGYYLGEPQPIK